MMRTYKEVLGIAAGDMARYNDVHPCGGTKQTVALEKLLISVMKELSEPGSGVHRDFTDE